MRPPKPISWVAQESNQSCAIASIAMATDVPFMTALKAVKGSKVRVVSGCGENKKFNIDTRADEFEMIKGIKKLGFTGETVSGSSVKFGSDRLILSFGWHWAPNCIHCVVWCPIKRLLLDPCDRYSSNPTYVRFDIDQCELVTSWRRWGSHAIIVKRP
mgnify:FL=1